MPSDASYPNQDPPHRSVTAAAFTLIEMLVVIAIIVVLVMLLMPALSLVRGKAHLAEAKQGVSQLVNAIEQYQSADARKRYPYPGPLPGNTNPYGPAAITYFRYDEGSDATRAFALAFHDDNGSRISGVLTLLETQGLKLPTMNSKSLDKSDDDHRLLDPWGHPYHYRLRLPKVTRDAFSCSHPGVAAASLRKTDWNFHTDIVRGEEESQRNGVNPVFASPYPYVYSWGKKGSSTDTCTWIYQADRR